uniref:Uncharacterized protein n=1 Tax=Sphaerodactylus townsendi TaxID=933632 RepID=A0ACB8E7L5_9SAUR
MAIGAALPWESQLREADVLLVPGQWGEVGRSTLQPAQLLGASPSKQEVGEDRSESRRNFSQCQRPGPAQADGKLVHQHQDRGETFQCQLCPFTSSRHFSLKLHMRCHQHFLRTEAKVKEEIQETDVKMSPQLNDDSRMGQQGEGAADSAGIAATSRTPEKSGQTGAAIPPLLVKEEPKDDNSTPSPSFALSVVDRLGNNTKLKDSIDFVTNTASALFSQDISVKMASDFLMKLSAHRSAFVQQKHLPLMQRALLVMEKDRLHWRNVLLLAKQRGGT